MCHSPSPRPPVRRPPGLRPVLGSMSPTAKRKREYGTGSVYYRVQDATETIVDRAGTIYVGG